jgi:hypothetical protein
MPKESSTLISTSLATARPDKTRTERLSAPVAMFWIVVLSLAGWTVVIALAHALV